MPLTPEDVRNRRFKTAFRGYDETEVDTFLDEVEVELTRLLGEVDTARERLQAAQAAPPPQPVHSEAEEMLRRTLLLAQRTADETVASAQADAERMTSEARAQAETLLRQAHERAAAETADLDRRKQELEQHIEGLRAFEREYRTRLKAYLEAQLRDLDGRGQPAPDLPAGPGPSMPSIPSMAAPPQPPVAPPAMPDPTPPGPAAPNPVMFGDDAEGDLHEEYPDDDEPEVPRLAP